MNSVCFSGHRRLKITKELKTFLYYKIIELIENGCKNFYTGCFTGWDMLCSEIIIDLRRKKYSDIRLNFIMPCCPEIHTHGWNQKNIKRYNNILANSDKFFTVSNYFYDGCIKDRYELMLNMSDSLLCYYNPKHFISRTGKVIRLAEKKNIDIINLFKT